MATKRVLDGSQHDLFKPDTTWRTPTSLPLDLLNYPVVALDTETCDPLLKEKGPGWFREDCKMVGVSLAWDDGKTYLPVAHGGGDNFAGGLEQVGPWLKHFLENYTGTVVMMNCIYDLGFLKYHKLLPRDWKFKLIDVMMVGALLDEHRQRYNLNSLASTYGLPQKDEAMLKEAANSFGVDPKGGLWQLPARFVGAYAEQDAALTLEVYKQQLPQVAAEKLERVVDLEHSLLPCLMEMRFKGVRVDLQKAAYHKNAFMEKFETMSGELKRLSGCEIDVWAAASVAKGMEALSITYPKTGSSKPKPSFTDEWLSSHPSEFARLVTKARKMHKAANTFCENMVIGHADKNGRVHPEFHPLRSDAGGTVSGRFSSSNPNLQQVPARDPEMNTIIRGLFLPEEGEQWAACDFSQQEPRLTIHYAAEKGCTRGQEAADRYNSDPDTDYHNFVASLVFGSNFTKQQRSIAKMINLGLAYSMGPAKLCKKLGLPTIHKTNTKTNREYETAGLEGQEILDRYNKEVPFIKELSTMFSRQANEHGYLATMSGRRCRFSFWEPTQGGRAQLYDDAYRDHGQNIKRAYTHAALNRKIQGGSADLIKITMRNLWREGFCPLVTVHDENGLSVPNNEKAKQVAEIMRDCVKLKVPMKVDVDIGPSWGEARPMTEED
jgi:DNA polymerase I-like protein with 3'-5' exonuclease and polymerase domains